MGDSVNNQEFLINIGKSISLARKEERLTQSALAKKVNIHRVTLSEIENGSPSSITTLLNILRALNKLSWIDPLINPKLSYKEKDYSSLFKVKSVSVYKDAKFKEEKRTKNADLTPSKRLIKKLKDNTF